MGLIGVTITGATDASSGLVYFAEPMIGGRRLQSSAVLRVNASVSFASIEARQAAATATVNATFASSVSAFASQPSSPLSAVSVSGFAVEASAVVAFGGAQAPAAPSSSGLAAGAAAAAVCIVVVGLVLYRRQQHVRKASLRRTGSRGAKKSPLQRAVSWGGVRDNGILSADAPPSDRASSFRSIVLGGPQTKASVESDVVGALSPLHQLPPSAQPPQQQKKKQPQPQPQPEAQPEAQPQPEPEAHLLPQSAHGSTDIPKTAISMAMQENGTAPSALAPTSAPTEAAPLVAATRWIRVRESSTGDVWFVDEDTQTQNVWQLPAGGVVASEMEAPAPAASATANAATAWVHVRETSTGDAWFVDEATQTQTVWQLPEGGFVTQVMDI